jgi:hypothetical protein
VPSATTTAPFRSTIETFFETKTASDIEGTMVFEQYSTSVAYERAGGDQLGMSPELFGGGFEWTADPSSDSLAGVTALELDAEGLISRITSVHDSRQLERGRKAGLVGAAFAPADPGSHP